jgi:hypothetical protein
MCGVPSAAVFCSESAECFPGAASKRSSKAFVTLPVTPVTTSIIIHLMFHVPYISIHKLMYFSFFSASFYMTFLPAGIATSISMHVFSFVFSIITSGLFAITTLCVPIIIIITILLVSIITG